MDPNQLAAFVKKRQGDAVAAAPSEREWLDEAGGISLYATIGSEAFLRPDGSVWFYDADNWGEPAPSYSWHRATDQEAAGAIKMGLKRWPELASLIPARRPDQDICNVCSGSGRLTRQGKVIGSGISCDTCSGVGYLI